MLEQTTWNSLRNLCGSLYSKHLNVGSQWINPDFHSNFWASRKVIRRGYYVTSYVAHSLRVFSSSSPSLMSDFGESISLGSGFSDLIDDDDEYVLYGL